MQLRFQLADEFRTARERKGMTQVEMAKRMRVAQPHVSRLEALGPASLAVIERACEALDLVFDFKLIDPEEMLRGSVGDVTLTVIEESTNAPEAGDLIMEPTKAGGVENGFAFEEPTVVSTEEPRDLGEVIRDQDDEPRVEPTP